MLEAHNISCQKGGLGALPSSKHRFDAISWSKLRFDTVFSTYENIPSMQRITTNHKVSWYEKGNKQQQIMQEWLRNDISGSEVLL